MHEPHLYIIFGATGDLTKRKLIPALFEHLSTHSDGRSAVLGIARTDLDDTGFRKLATESLRETGIAEADIERWCTECLFYQPVDESSDYAAIRERIEQIEADRDLPGNRIFYLALPPSAFDPVITSIGEAGLDEGPGWKRIVVEKPFGRDLESARQLNATIHARFDESTVYRIDHYLGKDTVQNLLVFRFANVVFESLWNRDRIERVEITVAENIDVANRAAYYDRSGAIRDMIQNHLTQLLTLVAMEPPAAFEPETIRNEKVKVLRSISAIRPEDVVLGQYTAGHDCGPSASDYLDHDGVAEGSTTPTFAAIKLFIDNWRWMGVPFFLRTGKALPRRETTIAVTFRQPPVSFFEAMNDQSKVTADVLTMTLQPDEGFTLSLDVKRPGERLALETIPLDFRYGDAFGPAPEAYETLLEDIVGGDQTLFVRADEVEHAWRVFEPLLDAGDPEPYAAGTWGPEAARRLLGADAHWATR